MSCEWCGSQDTRHFESNMPVLCRKCYEHYMTAYGEGYVDAIKAAKTKFQEWLNE